MSERASRYRLRRAVTLGGRRRRAVEETWAPTPKRATPGLAQWTPLGTWKAAHGTPAYPVLSGKTLRDRMGGLSVSLLGYRNDYSRTHPAPPGWDPLSFDPRRSFCEQRSEGGRGAIPEAPVAEDFMTRPPAPPRGSPGTGLSDPTRFPERTPRHPRDGGLAALQERARHSASRGGGFNNNNGALTVFLNASMVTGMGSWSHGHPPYGRRANEPSLQHERRSK
jgi:hypothetical protein